MTRRRFYAPPDAFNHDNGSVRLERDEAKHLRNVLRLGVGDAVYLFDGAGREFHCEITSFGRDEAVLSVLDEVAPQSPESKLELTLAVALLKGEKFGLVVQKATELGVGHIVPVMTKRADVRLDSARRGKTQRDERWTRLALEAAKQSGRARVPEVAAPVELSELLNNVDAMHAIMFAERAGTSLNDALDGIGLPRSLVALIGPEGGWETAEIEAARVAGWRIVTLGGRTLRAETAAIAVAALLQHRCGDLV
jgi:16S rRNA (uracil1498-N3)-methyltransferase